MAKILGFAAFGLLAEVARGWKPLELPRLLEAASDSARCEGKPAKTVRRPLGACFQDDMIPSASLVAKCHGKSLELHVFNGTACAGSSLLSQTMPVGQCFKSEWSRGMFDIITCEEAAYLTTSWSIAPAAPDGIFCGDEKTAAGGTLPVRTKANASLVDQLSFEIALPGGRPFLGFTAPLGHDGVAEVAIPGLRPSTAYEVSVRAHRRGEQEGNPGSWSSLGSVNATCWSSGASPSSRIPSGLEIAPESPKAATRWLEVYRMARGAQLADFLDQHNVGDLLGLFGMIGQLLPSLSLPLTRYCVEILDVNLPNITTGNSDGELRQSNFADYASCIQGQCSCTHQIDRSIARLPARQILDMCSGPAMDMNNNTCRCSKQSLAQSSRYIGRLAVPLPFVTEYGLGRLPVRFEEGYPSPVRPSPEGSWYSFPYGGRCPPDAAIGDGGCTWKRFPIFHTVYSDELRGLDRNLTFDLKRSRMTVSFEAALNNALQGERGFQRLPVDVPACGESVGVAFDLGLDHAALQLVV